MATVLINGINYSWPNAKLVILGVPIVGITKIEFSEKTAMENRYGIGSEPVSRGYGRTEYTASISLYAEEIKAIRDAAPNKRLKNIPPFDITMLLLPTLASPSVLPEKRVLRQAQFMEDNFLVNEGDTAIIMDMPLIIAGIE